MSAARVARRAAEHRPGARCRRADAAAAGSAAGARRMRVDAAAPAVEAIAQLEAEVEYKRQQVAAQIVELRDREQRLRAATSELERARRELARHAHGARRQPLERRSTRARRARQRPRTRSSRCQDRDAARRAQAARSAAPKSAARATSRRRTRFACRARRTHDAAADNVSVPALLCLTGDAPKRFAADEKDDHDRPRTAMRPANRHALREPRARSPHVSGGVTLIEDLGSRNGVFVNSVRVDRQAAAARRSRHDRRDTVSLRRIDGTLAP